MPVLSGGVLTGFQGFSANPLNPFDGGASRTTPFYDFNVACTYSVTGNLANDNPGGLAYWPPHAFNAGTVTSPLVYFRADNSSYFLADGTTPKRCSLPIGRVAAGVDTRLNNAWVNPSSIQIFSSGPDATYGDLSASAYATTDRLMFPTGENYMPNTYDDITNFSSGTLEDSIP